MGVAPDPSIGIMSYYRKEASRWDNMAPRVMVRLLVWHADALVVSVTINNLSH